jgi:LeuA allosteric (dimerisation) domain
MYYHINTNSSELIISNNTYKSIQGSNSIIPLIYQHLQNTDTRLGLLPKFIITAMGLGTSAIGECSIVVEIDGFRLTGNGSDNDIIFAAYDALKQVIEEKNSGQFDHELMNNIDSDSLVIRDCKFRRFSLCDYQIMAIQGQRALAMISLKDKLLGQDLYCAESGNGGLDAACNAINQTIRKIKPFELVLSKFNINTLEDTESAPGRASIILQDNQGNEFIGQNSDNNILVAAITAYVDAINDYFDSNNYNDHSLYYQ